MHYPNAPIREALIDIRVVVPPHTTVESLRRFRDDVCAQYPKEEGRNLAEGQFLIGPQVSASAMQRQIGYAYTSADGRQVVQARLDGFTFSRLEPYKTWEALRDEAKRLWQLYIKAAGDVRINRIAVRYINQILIPATEVELRDYLRTGPDVSPEIPGELSRIGGFFMQVLFPQPDLKGTLVLNETIAGSPKPNMTAVILDLDLFVEEPDLHTEQELWAAFEALRTRKNLFFEACITDKTRELIR